MAADFPARPYVEQRSRPRRLAVTIRTDPEGEETDALFDLVEFEGAHVLEIGAGDGRLTWRYAERAAHVTAVEPFEGSSSRARERLRETNLPIEFRHAAFEDFATDSDPDVFDVALLSWSLC
jgi:2-polyprenyl-3-methyl-5-hydroxy-6-metoxy-1,4-benzoquinol methylase